LDKVAAFYALHHAASEEMRLPVLSNVSATLVLYKLDAEGTVVDELSYSSKWHQGNVKETKGVALERIRPEGLTQDPANWTSASAFAGYGTPGYQNSQMGQENVSTEISAPVLKEDGLYHISYLLDASGYSCRASIFNMAGQRVAQIAQNRLLGSSGEFAWDARGRHLPGGIYIFYLELYHPDGRQSQYKKAFPVR
jgi:hypothetical protein